jgi:hypothetical protein
MNLGIRYSWTKDIISDRTSKAQIQGMIYTFGAHIESKILNEEITPKTEGTCLPAIDDLASHVRLLHQQLAALAATRATRDGRGNYMGRGTRTTTRGWKRIRLKDVIRVRKEGAHPSRLPRGNQRGYVNTGSRIPRSRHLFLPFSTRQVHHHVVSPFRTPRFNSVLRMDMGLSKAGIY